MSTQRQPSYQYGVCRITFAFFLYESINHSFIKFILNEYIIENKMENKNNDKRNELIKSQATMRTKIYMTWKPSTTIRTKCSMIAA